MVTDNRELLIIVLQRYQNEKSTILDSGFIISWRVFIALYNTAVLWGDDCVMTAESLIAIV